jgi:peptide/nickel transport system permease protein
MSAGDLGSREGVSALLDAEPVAAGSAGGRAGLRRLAANRLALVGGILALAMGLLALLAPILARTDPNAVDPYHPLLAPSGSHWFGTDNNGRDIFARVAFGARISMQVGLEVVLLAAVIGVTLGAIAGYWSGSWLDDVIMRALDVFIAFPSTVLAIAVLGVLGVKPLPVGPFHLSNLAKIVIVVGIVFAPRFARIVRASFLREREEQYVQAARSIGTSDMRIVLGEIMPNSIAPVVVQSTYYMATAILIEASLSFLGIGVTPPTPSWGSMLSEARGYIISGEWWFSLFPGMAILLTMAGFNLLGDGLRDALDPRTRNAGGAVPVLEPVAADAERRPPRRPDDEPLLRVENLVTSVDLRQGRFNAVDRVSFQLHEGQVLGLVGESAAGKSMTALSIIRLVGPPAQVRSGRVLLRGQDLLRLSEREMDEVRGSEIAMITQDPMTALNPVKTIGSQLTRVIRRHTGCSQAEATERAVDMMRRVGIPGPADRLRSYPHQFSGGMLQRISIAMALSCSPRLLIADEPTTALDVTIQAQILDLLRGLQSEMRMAVLLITHNLGVVAEFCDRVAVMYAGRIVEEAATSDLVDNPRHPYTGGLIGVTPSLDDAPGELPTIAGRMPDLHRLPAGCRFHPRCPARFDRCPREVPALLARPGGGEVACHLYDGDER